MLRFQQLPRPALPEGIELPEDISPRLARLLYARGAKTSEEMEAFLTEHPMDLTLAVLDPAIVTLAHQLRQG